MLLVLGWRGGGSVDLRAQVDSRIADVPDWLPASGTCRTLGTGGNWCRRGNRSLLGLTEDTVLCITVNTRGTVRTCLPWLQLCQLTEGLCRR